MFSGSATHRTRADASLFIGNILVFHRPVCGSIPEGHPKLQCVGLYRRGAMGELVFLCPKTARELETGITTDRGRIARTRRRTIYLDCPHCLETHSFKVSQGWIDNYARSVPPLAEIA